MNTTTRTTTATAATTVTITASDVRQLMGFITLEMTTICQAAGEATRDFNLDTAAVDLSLMVLNDLVSSIQLQLYLGSELIREYRYVISDTPLPPSGPPAERPPLGFVPPGARVRLAAMPNPHQSKEVRSSWFARLGWSDAPALVSTETAAAHTFGTFCSGGLAVSRQLLSNPKYDKAIS